MARERYTTTIDGELLKSAKIRAIQEGLEGANAIIEKALKMYLSNKGSLWMRSVKSDVDIKLFLGNKETFIIGEIREEHKKELETEELINKGYKKIGDIL